MNRIIVKISWLLAMGLGLLSGCGDGSINTLDYYYPLDKIENFVVYEYLKVVKEDDQELHSMFYYKIYRNDNKTFSQVILDQNHRSRDSIVLRITDSEILIVNAFLSSPKGYCKSNEVDQLLYPLTLNIGEIGKSTFTHDSIKGQLYKKLEIDIASQLLSFDSDFMEVELIMDLNLAGNQEGYTFAFRDSSIITNAYGKGMTNKVTYRGEVTETVTFKRVWTEAEWRY